jgi:hypothetical protein
MLYITHDAVDDDLFAIYATVHENRKKPGFLVTNDL